jgi:hypothetical protein
MTPKRTAAYLGGASLLAAWLASAAGLVSREPLVQDTPQPVQTAGTETLAADVQAQTERLRHRLASAPAPQEPSRNPFAFAQRPDPLARRAARAPEPATPPPTLVAEPPLTLIGIAETQTPDGIVRTAMITTAAGELITVTRGEAVIGRYRVDVVDADAVVLSDVSNGAVRRLALRD